MPQIEAFDLSTALPYEKVEGMINNRGKQNLPPEVETLMAVAYDLSINDVVGPNSSNNYKDNLICLEGENDDTTT